MRPYVIGAEIPIAAERVIHRAQIPIYGSSHTEMEIPAQVRLIHIAPSRNGEYGIDLWYERVWDGRPDRPVTFHVVGTGYPVKGYDYIGTVVMHDDYVWHLYLQYS